MDAPLDDALEQLYSGPPDTFVARRAALAAELSAKGLKAEAAEIKRRRRPSAAAAAVNDVVRSHPDELHALGIASDRMHAAQADAVAGRGATDLRAATRARKELVDQLTDAAVAALVASSPQPESYRAAIANTFEAATIDPAARVLVESGLLVKELSLPSGLSPDAAGVPAPRLSVAQAPKRKERGDPRADARAARAKEAETKAAIADARRAQHEAQRIADRNDAAAMHARATADEAAGAVVDLEAQLADARRADREARTAARVADQVARASAAQASKATARLDQLEILERDNS